MIPLVDLQRQQADLAPRIEAALRAVCARADFILGAAVQEFEQAFAAYLGVRHVVGVASGTDALHLALRALGVGPGDEVIVPANTFIATALAVTYCGATPVLVDCDLGTALIDASAAEAAVTPRTRAVVPVHLYGQPADVDAILRWAAPRGIHVVEDAAQAHGARYRGRPCGSLGVAAGFSFYPGKNLGANGDGGAVVTSDDRVAAEVRVLRNLGSGEQYVHRTVGYNSRLDTLQAAVLGVKLGHLDGWNETRAKLAARYRDGLADLVDEVEMVDVAPWTTRHAYHLLVVRVLRQERDAVVARLRASGVGAQVHYPIPIHLQDAYRSLGKGPGSFPSAERLAREVLSLPLCPYIGEDRVAAVARRLRDALRWR